jgi:hypothetical protein
MFDSVHFEFFQFERLYVGHNCKGTSIDTIKADFEHFQHHPCTLKCSGTIVPKPELNPKPSRVKPRLTALALASKIKM